MRSLSIVALLVFILSATTFSAGINQKRPKTNYPLKTGSEEVQALVVYPPYPLSPSLDDREIVGDTIVVGTTWYENQHNGTCGRMLDKDDQGIVHIAWMNGLNSGATQRHIYYNYVNSNGTQGWPGCGYPVENSERAGFAVLDVAFGNQAFPCFHWIDPPGGDFWTAAGFDFVPYTGSFIVYPAPPVAGLSEVIWPVMQFDRNGLMHIVATENPDG